MLAQVDSRQALEEQLELSMKTLILVMRDFLGNLQEERQALLLSRPAVIEKILRQRECLLDEMAIQRQKINRAIHKIQPLGDFEKLAEIPGSDNLSFLILKDQILALSEGIERQNLRNGRLMVLQQQPETIQQTKVGLLVLDPELA